jgi:hypothetical protein
MGAVKGILAKQEPVQSFIKIIWKYLSSNSNPEAIEYLKENPNKIDWSYLSSNPNPEAIKLLIANPSKIDWEIINYNINSLEIYKRYPERLNSKSWIWANKEIFYEEYDIKDIKKVIEIILIKND